MIFFKKIHLIIINALFMQLLSEWRLMMKYSSDNSLYYKRIYLISQLFIRLFQWLFRWRKQLDSHLIVKWSSILSFDFSDDCVFLNFIQELRTQLNIHLFVKRSSLALVDIIACNESLDTTSDNTWNEVAIISQFDKQTLSRLFLVDK